MSGILRKLTYAKEKFEADRLVEDFQNAVGKIADGEANGTPPPEQLTTH